MLEYDQIIDNTMMETGKIIVIRELTVGASQGAMFCYSFRSGNGEQF